ncbi:hypothetical protein RESH_04894 [Rhodopirellula europaea SH398]|uniref:Uncharacterized protein n=1 Tax=Rhodopirellula europaea SH398 TaxID=1263868 RepID=M5RYT9_9BACT|nr:hypothetical protein RESH_04894 [Rhodopirellula europaea SH398]
MPSMKEIEVHRVMPTLGSENESNGSGKTRWSVGLLLSKCED